MKGNWYFCCLKGKRVDASNLALPDGNTQQRLAELIIPRGTWYLEGTIASLSQFAEEGGNTQYYVPHGDQAALRRLYERVPDLDPTADLIVRQGDTSARFRSAAVSEATAPTLPAP